jgi:uncharacterized cofD-like protein
MNRCGELDSTVRWVDVPCYLHMENKEDKRPRVVVLGGGNGTSRLMAALRPLVEEGKVATAHAVVHMADDGGSTGRLRRQYNTAALGDLSKCLMALSGYQGDIRGEEFLRALDYRFAHGDFEGHSLRNMFLAALEMTSDIDTAIATMARILQVPKHTGVVPATLKTLTQQVYISFNGTQNFLGEGQHSIAHQVNLQADPRWKPGDVRVTFAEGDVPLNSRAQEILEKASHVVIAPGHTYGTILPTLALPALQRTIKGLENIKLLVVMALLTTPRQTSGWNGEDFMRVYEQYLGRQADVVVANSAKVKIELVKGQEWVEFKDKKHQYELLEDKLVLTEAVIRQPGDVVPRAVAVHDANKIRRLLVKLIGISD